jgi:hypothetical protein
MSNERQSYRSLAVSEKIAMALSGHKTRSVFDRYNNVSKSDVKHAAAKLDSYLAKKTKPHAKGRSARVGPLQAHKGAAFHRRAELEHGFLVPLVCDHWARSSTNKR